MRLQYRIALLTLATMVFALVSVGVMVYDNVSDYIESSIGRRALAISKVVASVPTVQRALLSPDPTAVLQPIAEKWRQDTGAAFVIVSNMNAIRLSYPVPEMIGTPMAKLPRERVLHGEDIIYIGQGRLAPSLRANSPIFNPDTGEQIGFVSVGFYLDDIEALIDAAGGRVVLAIIAAMLFCLAAAALLANQVRKELFDLEPFEVATILNERIATLEAIHEGVVAVGVDRRISILNNEACRLLDLQPDQAIGMKIDDVLPDNQLTDVMERGLVQLDQQQRIGDRLIVSNSIPIVVGDKVSGAVVSFRDRTEVTRLAEELTGVNRFVDALRAQTHEFKNKLHTIAGLIQLRQYDAAIDYAIENSQDQEELLGHLRRRIQDPVISGLLLGKASQMKEQGVEFTIDPASHLVALPVNVTSGDLVLIIGNLLNNAMEAQRDFPTKEISLLIKQAPGELVVRVKNTGPWIDEALGERIFDRGVSGKPGGTGIGLSLIKEKVKLVGGSVRYENQPEGGVLFDVRMPYGG